MSLIEVVAGLALLSSVLVGIFAAKSHAASQQARAVQRLDAIQAADALLAEWWESIETFPRNAEGRIANHPGLSWRTRAVPSRAGDQLGVQVIRVEVFGETDTNARASVEVILPPEQFTLGSVEAKR